MATEYPVGIPHPVSPETRVGLRYCPITTKTGICRQISVKSPNIKFPENLFSRVRGLSWVVTDRRTEFFYFHSARIQTRKQMKAHICARFEPRPQSERSLYD